MEQKIIILDDVRRDAESLKSNLCNTHGYANDQVTYYLQPALLYAHLAEIDAAQLSRYVIILDLWWGETKNSSRGEEMITHLKRNFKQLRILVVSNFLDIVTYQKVQMLGADGALDKQDFEHLAKQALGDIFQGESYFVKKAWNNLEMPDESKVGDLVLYLALGFKNKYAAAKAGLGEDSANTYKSKLAKVFGECLSDEANQFRAILPKEGEWNEIAFLLMGLRNRDIQIIQMIEEVAGVKILVDTPPLDNLNYNEIVKNKTTR